MPKCEHGLTSKECYVCASPKHGAKPERHFCERCGKRLSQDGIHTCTPPQQAEPVEPVAWMFELARNFNLEGYGGWEKRITEYRPNTPEGSVRNVTPLYTAPPQRAPLTEEEIIDATEHIDTSRNGYFIHIARAIERAHKIGDNT